MLNILVTSDFTDMATLTTATVAKTVTDVGTRNANNVTTHGTITSTMPQQTVSSSRTLTKEPVFLVIVGLIAGVVLALSGVLLVHLLSHYITRKYSRRYTHLLINVVLPITLRHKHVEVASKIYTEVQVVH